MKHITLSIRFVLLGFCLFLSLGTKAQLRHHFTTQSLGTKTRALGFASFNKHKVLKDGGGFFGMTGSLSWHNLGDFNTILQQHNTNLGQRLLTPFEDISRTQEVGIEIFSVHPSFFVGGILSVQFSDFSHVRYIETPSGEDRTRYLGFGSIGGHLSAGYPFHVSTFMKPMLGIQFSSKRHFIQERVYNTSSIPEKIQLGNRIQSVSQFSGGAFAKVLFGDFRDVDSPFPLVIAIEARYLASFSKNDLGTLSRHLNPSSPSENLSMKGGFFGLGISLLWYSLH